MNILIDFDGVIHDHLRPMKRMGVPVEGAKEALTLLKRKYKIIVFTVWGGTLQGRDTIRKWLEYYEIPFDEITNIKQEAEFYIDDKAIRFMDWDTTLWHINQNG